MKMKSKLLCVPMVMAVMAELVIATPAPKLSRRRPAIQIYTTPWTRPTGSHGKNLKGKMFTLALNRGGVIFYPPYFSPSPSPWPSNSPYLKHEYTTRSYTTTDRPYTSYPSWTTNYPSWTTNYPYWTTNYPSWTTEAPTRGVSVCLRYLTDLQAMNPKIFTLSPSTSPLKLIISDRFQYTLSYGYYNLYLKPDIRFWSNTGPDIWTRICLTVDSKKKVAQMFSGSNISIRKMLPIQYVWSGEPVIDFSGFDGQVTDVQVWDYPLRSGEIFSYMTNGAYMPYRGSVLTWSSIGFSLRGSTLLEDTYQSKQPIISRLRSHWPKQEKKNLQFFNMVESNESNAPDNQ